MGLLRSIVRRFVPDSLVKKVGECKFHYNRSICNRNHEKRIEELKVKDKVKVAFFLIHSSVWKYDELLKLMLKDDRFEPIVVICPYLHFGEKQMNQDFKEAEKFILDKGYPYVMTYNKETMKWLDVRKTINPDIIFFTNPHKGLTKKEYYITNFLDTLTCYVPYAFMAVDTYESQFNSPMHNLVWKVFYETPMHERIAQQHAYNKGGNVMVSGYPGCDLFLDKNYISQCDPWKNVENKRLKKIIWAPHHLMRDGIQNSNFEQYAEIMLNIAEKYKDNIQIAFKPHPLVRAKLYSFENWGKIKTDQYFKKWDELENGQLEEGGYVDLFHNADAMIHDSGSFISEFITMNKPTMYMIRNENIMKGWNEYGAKAINAHYKSYNYNDLINFIENVVIKNNDHMKSQRTKFIEQNLVVYNDSLSATQRIFNYIKSQIS